MNDFTQKVGFKICEELQANVVYLNFKQNYDDLVTELEITALRDLIYRKFKNWHVNLLIVKDGQNRFPDVRVNDILIYTKNGQFYEVEDVFTNILLISSICTYYSLFFRLRDCF